MTRVIDFFDFFLEGGILALCVRRAPSDYRLVEDLDETSGMVPDVVIKQMGKVPRIDNNYHASIVNGEIKIVEL